MTGIHTPVATTTHTQDKQFFRFFCSYFLSRLFAHTLGMTGIHTPVATTTHTLGRQPAFFPIFSLPV